MSMPLPPLNLDFGSSASSAAHATQGSTNHQGFTGGSIGSSAGLSLPNWLLIAGVVAVAVFFYVKK